MTFRSELFVGVIGVLIGAALIATVLLWRPTPACSPGAKPAGITNATWQRERLVICK